MGTSLAWAQFAGPARSGTPQAPAPRKPDAFPRLRTSACESPCPCPPTPGVTVTA
jgi:hypothetical protein